jgi:hypothetical protein
MPLLKYYDPATSQWLPILAGAKGDTGLTGPTGATGATGPAGLGSVAVTAPITNAGTSTAAVIGIEANRVIPAGGTTGQVLSKASGTDFDTTWEDQTDTPGFTLLSNNAFTSATVLTLSNIFNTDYTSYRIYFNLTSATSNQEITLQLTSGGTPSTASYASVETSLSTNTTSSSWPLGQTGQGRVARAIELFNPRVAARTYGTCDWWYDDGTTLIYKKRGMTHRVNTAYDGLRFTVASGMTGSVRVFGIKQ